MYKGTNPTAIQSQKWLADSMAALMNEKSFGQITIQDLCKRADLSRQTFYNFFKDKESVLRFCLEQTYTEQFSKLADRESLLLSDILDAFFFVIKVNRKLIDAILRDGLDFILADEMLRCISLFANRFVSDEKRNEMLPYAEAMLSGALSQLLMLWIRTGQRIPASQISELLVSFFTGEIYNLNAVTGIIENDHATHLK